MLASSTELMLQPLFSTILLVHTGTPEAGKIADLTVTLAKSLRARVIVLGVYVPFSPDAEVIGLDRELATRARPQFEQEVDRLSKLAAVAGVSLSAEMVEEGIPDLQIEQRTKTDRVDLVVVGHKLMSRFKHWFEASTSETLVSRAKTAVLVIPEEEMK